MSNDNSPGNSRPSDFDKLSDSLDKKMLDFNFKMLGVLASILFKPAAVATEPFFRKNMGERYFTYTNAILASMIWSGVGVLNKLFAGTWEFESERTVAHAETIGGLILLVFLILAAANISAARERQKKGIRWHSTCRGESLFGSENSIRDWIITAVIVFALYKLHAGFYAALFLLSRVFSEYLEQQRQQSLYNRYLDVMDAQIESEYLQQTLAKGPSPMVTDGIYCPLPGRFKGEHREKVARVVAGTFSAPDVAGAPAASSPEAKAAGMPDPLSEWSAQINKVSGQIWKVLLEVYAFIGPKRLIRSVIVLLAIVACVYGGRVIFRVAKAHWKSAVVAPVAVTQSPPSNPIPTPPPVTAPVAVVKSPTPVATPPVAAPAEILTADSSVDSAAPAPSAQERQNAMDLLNDILLAENGEVSRFKNDCETALATNANQIAGLSLAYRQSLTKQHDDVRDSLADLLEKQNAALQKVTQYLPILSANPKSNPPRYLAQIEKTFSQMKSDRQLITGDLQTLAASISNAR